MTAVPRSDGISAPKVRRILIPAGILLLAALLARLWNLAVDGLWVDEAYTDGLCRLSLSEMFQALRADDAPPLFYLLERIPVSVGGDSEGMLRLLPALFGVATVFFVWRLARRHAPAAAGLALAASGFSALLIFYSRQARSYSLIHLAAALLFSATSAVREAPSRRNLGFLAGAAWLALYAHNLGALLLAAATLSLLDQVRRPERRIPLVIAAGVIAIGAIPWAVRLIVQLQVHQVGNQWMGAWWSQARSLSLAPLYSWAAFANGAAVSLHPPIPLPGLEGVWMPLAWLGWIVAAAGLFGAARAWRRGQGRALLGTLLAFALFPLVGLVLISHGAGPAYVLGRTDSLALPAFLLLIALGWTAWPRRVGLVLAAIWVALGVASFLPLWSGHARITKQSDRALARSLGARVQPGDAIVYSALTRPSLEYYARRQGWAETLRWHGSYPGVLDRNAAAVAAMPLDSAAVWQEEALRLREEWTGRGVRRVWLLAMRDDRSSGRSATAGFPTIPTSPPASRRTIDATRVGYPTNVLLSTLAGLHEVPVELEYRQDWVAGERILLRVDREEWVPLDSIPSVKAAP